MSDKPSPMVVDIVSDVVCPWCVIGYRQLVRALEESGFDATIAWHPFELNPDMAEDGENLREHLSRKYGTTREDSVAARERLTALGAELGFTFDYTDDMRMFNTWRAHQLLFWARQKGQQHTLKMALFQAFFTDRRPIGSIGELSVIAGETGLDGAEAEQALQEGRFADIVRREENTWLSRGIRGVPAMIFNQQYMVTGAQGVSNYREILAQVSGSAAA